MTADQVVRAARRSSFRPLGAVTLSLTTVLLFTVVLGMAFLPQEVRRLADNDHWSVARCHFLEDANRAVVLTRSMSTELETGLARMVALHDLTGRRPRVPLVFEKVEPLLTTVSADRRWLFCLATNREIYAIDLQDPDLQPRRLGQHPGETVCDLVCSAEGAVVLLGGPDGLYAWNASEGRLLWHRDGRPVSCWALAPSSRCLMVEFGDGELVELELLTGRALRTVRSFPESHVAMALASTADVLALLGHGGELDVVSVQTGQPVWPASAAPRLAYRVPGAVQFSPCGRYLVTAAASDLHSLTVWNAASGERLGKLCGHEGPVKGAEFTPDGRLHSWSQDGTIRTWDCQTLAGTRVALLGRKVQTRELGPGSSATFSSVSESPDARTLARAPTRAPTRVGDRRHE